MFVFSSENEPIFLLILLLFKQLTSFAMD